MDPGPAGQGGVQEDKWGSKRFGTGRTRKVAACHVRSIKNGRIGDGTGRPGEEVEDVLVVVRPEQEIIPHHVQLDRGLRIIPRAPTHRPRASFYHPLPMYIYNKKVCSNIANLGGDGDVEMVNVCSAHVGVVVHPVLTVDAQAASLSSQLYAVRRQ